MNKPVIIGTIMSFFQQILHSLGPASDPADLWDFETSGPSGSFGGFEESKP